MVKLALPTFQSGPQDELASVDIYEQKTAGVINSIQEIADEHDLSTYESLRGEDFKALSKGSILESYNPLTGVQVNKDTLMARIGAASSAVRSGIRELSDQVQGTINKMVPGNMPLMAKVGSIVRTVQSTDLKSLTSIGRTIDALGGGGLFSVQDFGAQVGLYSGIINEATKLGIPNSFGSLMAAVENPAILHQVALRSLPSIVGTSDIYSLSAMAAQLSQGNVKNMLPQVVGEFARNYRRTVQVAVPQKKEDWELISETFHDIDPSWHTAERVAEDGTSEQVMSLHNLSGASVQLREAATMHALTTETDPEKKLLVLANVYEPTTVDDQLRAHFPQTDVGEHHRIVTNPLDPIAATAMLPLQEQNKPVLLKDWILSHPDSIRAGFGDDFSCAWGGYTYRESLDRGKLAPVSITAQTAPTPQAKLSATEAALRAYQNNTETTSSTFIAAARDGTHAVGTQYFDATQGTDYGPSSMFEHDLIHADEEPAPQRSRTSGAIIDRNDW